MSLRVAVSKVMLIVVSIFNNHFYRGCEAAYDCYWWSYTSTPENRPNCPVVPSLNSTGGYTWQTLSEAQTLCASLYNESCNTVERWQSSGSDDEYDHNYLNSCPTTNPDELEWIEDTRWGFSVATAITYFYEC